MRHSGWILALALHASCAAWAASPVPLSSYPLDPERNVSIGPVHVYVDRSFTGPEALGRILIEPGGTLEFPDQTLTLETAGIIVQGLLRAGTEARPIDHQVEIRFLGAQPAECPGNSAPVSGLCHQKGILVQSGATLEMFGRRGVVNATGNPTGGSWTYLAAPAGPKSLYGPRHSVASPVLNELGRCPDDPPGTADKMPLQLSGAVDWQPGDWIVVGTTDFVEHNSEFVRIACLTPSSPGTMVWLDPATPLVNYHFGGPAPSTGNDPGCGPRPAAFCDGFAKNYGVDERAEVGLISRNIKLTAKVPVLPFWAAGTAYATGATIQATVGACNNNIGTTYMFTATAGGTSSGTAVPVFPGSGTVSDGTVTWTSSGEAALHWGGEINILAGSHVWIQGVEIEKFGKDQQGSFPVQVLGTPASFVLDSNSIHHSYNKGIVLGSMPGEPTGASGLSISSNVVARAVGHLFNLADGQETGNTFDRNLGLGAMSYSFSANPDSSSINPNTNILYTPGILSTKLFWSGDYLTNGASPYENGYDGFNVTNTDSLNSNAWPTGFYITNPDNTFTNNSIGGCQGQGRGFWYLAMPAGPCPPMPPVLCSASQYTTPACPAQTAQCPTQEVSLQAAYLAEQFSNNRAHACYNGLDTVPETGTDGCSLCGCPLQPQFDGRDLVTRFEGMTATRNRNLGIWVRPGWYHIDNARLAANRDSISLVSSGGTEGSPPGEWSLLSNSVIVGISANNTGRFGPCPYSGQGAAGGGLWGCVDEAQEQGLSYPDFKWNLFGYMFYDGPARLESNKFINFLRDPSEYLTSVDRAALAYFAAQAGNQSGPQGLLAGGWGANARAWDRGTPVAAARKSTSLPFIYEGDAALGWFQSNLNSYPPTQYTEGLIFQNVDFRHEVYTQEVNLSTFQDGDKNTVVLDRDGTLTGYQVVGPACQAGQTCPPVEGKDPVSLNNLPFLGTPYSVDECLATGAQDERLEHRPTALVSPQDYATLEFSVLTPAAGNDNPITFTKDQLDDGGRAGEQMDGTVPCQEHHSCMNLQGRNGQGIYEPKVINGLGYTVSAQRGFARFLDVAYTDANVAGGISASNPFSIRLGICYATAKGKPGARVHHPTAGCSKPPCPPFTIKKGRKSLAGPIGDPHLLDAFWRKRECNDIDSQDPDYLKNCPSPTITILQPVDSIAALTPDTYFYDASTGMLFFDVQQTEPNGALPGTKLPNGTELPAGGGPSPLGSCYSTNSDACPDESFYSCPVEGCVVYSVQVEEKEYQQGASTCEPYLFPPTYEATGTPPDYSLPYPSGMNQLAYVGGPLDGQPVQPVPVPRNYHFDGNFPHSIDPNEATLCSTFSGSTEPPWINESNPEHRVTTFTLGLPAGVKVTFSPAVQLIDTTGGWLAPLGNGTYTLTASGGSSQTCSQTVTVIEGKASTDPGGCCRLGISGSGPGATLGIGSPGAWCTSNS